MNLAFQCAAKSAFADTIDCWKRLQPIGIDADSTEGLETKGEKEGRANIGKWKPVRLQNSQNPIVEHWSKRVKIRLNQIKEFNFFKTSMLRPEPKALSKRGERRKSKYWKVEAS